MARAAAGQGSAPRAGRREARRDRHRRAGRARGAALHDDRTHRARSDAPGAPPRRPAPGPDLVIAAGRVRRLGYRVVGGRLDYLLHLRPAEWPIMAAHTALGYVLAVGLAGVARGVALAPA